MKTSVTDLKAMLNSSHGGLYVIPTETKPFPEIKEIVPGLLKNEPEKIGLLVSHLKSKRK